MLNTDRLCPGCMNDNGGEQICSICGYDMSSKNGRDCLPVRYLLSERYIIGKKIGHNPEGITYLAWDNATDSAVNIKEYYPKDIAVRNPDRTVSVVAGNEFSFNEGLMDFMEINKKLIAIELPSVVPVQSVFEENGTVYAITPVISGITLHSFLDKNGGILRWEQARPLFLPLIDTIKGLHDIGIIHGGISPETVIVGRDGKVRLTGICIPRLRRATSDSPAELYSGYAAAEQYGKVEATVDEYTDVYALSALLFRVLIGVVPPSAESRLLNDNLSIPARFADELPRQVLVAIANGMQVNPRNRTDSIDTFRNELVYGETKENMRRASGNKTTPHKVVAADSAKEKTAKPKSQGVKYAAISGAITAGVFLAIGLVLCIVFWDSLFPKDDVIYNESGTISLSEKDQLGDVDEDAVESTILYEVPDFRGKYYYQVIDDENYERFKFSIKGKDYSENYEQGDEKYERGEICAQTVAPGTEVEKETEIQFIISLGPREVTVPDVVGKDVDEAKLELLKKGFLYENIEVVEKYDEEAPPKKVIEQSPEYKEKVNTEVVIRIYVNSYEGEEEESSDESSDYEYSYND